MQLYDRRKKVLKKEGELKKWKEIDFKYMTDESDGDEVKQHKLTWRSDS